ncbi:MAG: DUF3256 family protein, partial [Dysgonamonadaceae bacterium]|nr:DUF3256 family protein [Dysgonamonadaceae bacterium]
MKRISIGIIAGCMLISVKAQPVKEIFITTPDVALLPLTAAHRMDLIDLYMNDQEAVVQNSFGDKVVLNHLTENYLNIQSGNATTELFILTLANESRIIGLIQTVCAPVCDSRLEFYSLKWKKLDTDLFISLEGKSGFIKEDADSPALDITLMEYHYDAEKQCLSQTYNTPAYASPEDREIIERTIREKNLTYQWNGIRFVRH